MLQSPPIRRAEALGIDVELRVICNDGWRMAPHWHDDLQVIATLQGEAEAVVGNDAPVSLPVGALIVLPPGAPHTAYGVGKGQWTFHSLHLSPSRLGYLAPMSDPVVVRGCEQPLTRRFTELIKSLFAKKPKSVDLCCAAFVQELGRSIDAVNTSVPNRGLLHAVVDQLSRNLTANISITDLAAAHGLSAGHLSRAFRKAYGMPPHAWRTNARVETAKRHLRAGQSVAKAAELSGFRDSSHLARQCKLLTSLTPRAYKRSVKPN